MRERGKEIEKVKPEQKKHIRIRQSVSKCVLLGLGKRKKMREGGGREEGKRPNVYSCHTKKGGRRKRTISDSFNLS